MTKAYNIFVSFTKALIKHTDLIITNRMVEEPMGVHRKFFIRNIFGSDL